MSAYYSLVILGLCLLMGYAGQISLGHAAFFAIGGYTSAVLTTCDLSPPHGACRSPCSRDRGRWSSPPGRLRGASLLTFRPGSPVAAAVLVTVVVAFLIGIPVLRLKGHYLAMATLGLRHHRVPHRAGQPHSSARRTGSPTSRRSALPGGLVVTGDPALAGRELLHRLGARGRWRDRAPAEPDRFARRPRARGDPRSEEAAQRHGRRHGPLQAARVRPERGLRRRRRASF